MDENQSIYDVMYREESTEVEEPHYQVPRNLYDALLFRRVSTTSSCSIGKILWDYHNQLWLKEFLMIICMNI